MYNMNDYRAALVARDEKELFSEEWNAGQAKVQAIVAVMIATGSKEMVMEIRDELYSMNDSGVSFPIMQYSLTYGCLKAMDMRE